MAITHVGTGALAANAGTGGGTIAPALPAGTQADDVAYLAVMTNAANTFPAITGWTKMGTLINSANQSTDWYWRRLTGTGDAPAAFTIAGGTALASTNGLYGRIYVWRGAVESGTPHEAVANAGTPTSSTTPQSSAVTTLGANRLVVHIVMVDDDNTWASGMPPAGYTNAGPRASSTTGGDCMSDAITIDRAAAGTQAAVTIGTQSAADFWRSLSFALIPSTAQTLPLPTATETDTARPIGADVGDVLTTELTAGSNPNAGTSFVTDSVDPRADAVVWLAVAVRHATLEPSTPTVSGCGLTWAAVGAIYFDESTTRTKLFVFRGHAASPSAGAITISHGATSHEGAVWNVSQSVNVNNPSTPVVQTVAADSAEALNTGLGLTLPGAVTSGNTVISFVALFDNTAGQVTPEAGYSQVSFAGPEAGESNLSVGTYWDQADADQTPSWTWATSALSGGVAVEVAKLAVTGDQSFPLPTATESDTGQPLSIALGVPVAGETDAAATTLFYALDIAPALETDAAQTITVDQGASSPQTIAVPTANETDAAQIVTVASAISVAVTPATEVDAAQPVTVDQAGAQTLPISTATESDSAQGLSIARSIAAATEADAAQTLAVTTAVTASISPAAETDAALAPSVALGVTPATEVDAAQPAVVTQVIAITPATESDAAPGLSATLSATLSVGIAEETDTAQTIVSTGGVISVAAAARTWRIPGPETYRPPGMHRIYRPTRDDRVASTL